VKKYLVSLFLASVCFYKTIAQSSIILPNGTVISSTTQANRPISPVVGQLVYQTDGAVGLYLWNGISWTTIAAGNSGTVTNVTGASPILVANGSTTPIISLQQASSISNGFLTNTDWSMFNSKFSLPNLTDGSVLFSNGTTISQNNGSFKWNNASRRLDVKGLNNGTLGDGFNNWISASFGGSDGNRVVLGVQNGTATIGAHTSNLDAWAKLIINPNGNTAIGSLLGIGTRMVVANDAGEVGTQAIPTFSGDNLGNHTASQSLNLGSNKLVGNGGTNGISIANDGTTTIETLAGASNRMVIANANGQLSSQSIPTFSGDNLGNHTASQSLNLGSNKIVGNGGTNGISIANDGTATIETLAGANNRMVIANASGQLSSQSIPTFSGDNLGNHTASQSLNLGTFKLTGNGGANGISIANDGGLKSEGNVGIRVDNPLGALEIAKTTVNYNNTFNQLAGTISASTSDPCCPPSSTNGSFSPVWVSATYMNSTATGFSGTVTLSYDLTTPKVVRKYLVSYIFPQPIYDNQTNPSGRLTYSWVFEASNDNSSWTMLDTRQLVQGNTIGNGQFRIFNEPTVQHTNAYRYYRLRFTECYIFDLLTNQIYFSTRPALNDFNIYEENTNSTHTAGAFTVKMSGEVGVGTTAPTANLDVVGTLRLRNGALANSVLIGDANGNASWTNSMNTLNATNANLTNLGVGTTASSSNGIVVSKTGGIKVSSTNTGSGTSDWIALNAGGATGDRVVAGILNGKATIGAHNNELSAWSNLVINNGGGSLSVGGEGLTPPYTNQTTTLGRPMAVHGSIRQGFYAVTVSIPPYGVSYITWTHNLGYGPILMMSTDQNGGGNNMDYVITTTLNNNTNESVFVLRNHGGTTANGTLRWILVW
jgi:hypothetical protein